MLRVREQRQHLLCSGGSVAAGWGGGGFDGLWPWQRAQHLQVSVVGSLRYGGGKAYDGLQSLDR